MSWPKNKNKHFKKNFFRWTTVLLHFHVKGRKKDFFIRWPRVLQCGWNGKAVDRKAINAKVQFLGSSEYFSLSLENLMCCTNISSVGFAILVTQVDLCISGYRIFNPGKSRDLPAYKLPETLQNLKSSNIRADISEAAEMELVRE